MTRWPACTSSGTTALPSARRPGAQSCPGDGHGGCRFRSQRTRRDAAGSPPNRRGRNRTPAWSRPGCAGTAATWAGSGCFFAHSNTSGVEDLGARLGANDRSLQATPGNNQLALVQLDGSSSDIRRRTAMLRRCLLSSGSRVRILPGALGFWVLGRSRPHPLNVGRDPSIPTKLAGYRLLASDRGTGGIDVLGDRCGRSPHWDGASAADAPLCTSPSPGVWSNRRIDTEPSPPRSRPAGAAPLAR